jgi:hypothetical protein
LDTTTTRSWSASRCSTLRRASSGPRLVPQFRQFAAFRQTNVLTARIFEDSRYPTTLGSEVSGAAADVSR